ncbi:hypothetical protein QR46_4885 [Giardia duodenalis assemblage B]|uniref:Uncharacterized protein n=1 Tax=Giardia duodenalis assemblage B TaxID=1394984 RepID=A0A132NM55_GIAIN|nr:hypothetical protein QR46_4885 [Giardia intestinalis assemblage B]
MSLDGPARRSDASAGAEPAVKSLSSNDKTTLMWAAAREDVAEVRRHLDECGRRDVSGMTALMHAASNGSIGVLRILLEHEKGMRDNQDHTALYHALRTEHIEAAKIILPLEDPTDCNGVTALMRAAVKGDAEMVKLLAPLQKGMKDRVGNTAFMHALKNKHTDIALLLREHEAPSWTFLMCAAFTGDIEITGKHLSERNRKNSDSDTALMRAAERGDMKAVRALIPLQKGKKMMGDAYINGLRISRGTALMIAATCRHTKVVGLLVEHEGGMQDDAGWTALMFAAKSGHADCVKLLLEKEGGMRDKDGWSASRTALMSAAQSGRTECVKLLIEKESGMQDKDGRTALMLAAINGYIECVKLLLEKEKNMKTTYEWCGCLLGSTSLILAAQNRRDDVVKLLMEHEGGVSGWTRLIYSAYLGDIDAVRDNLHEQKCKDVNGRSALLWGARQGHREVVKILLEHEKEVKDEQGHSALYHALSSGHMEVAEIIIPYEDPTDENGVTALMRAAAREDTEMVGLLAPLQKGMKDKDGNTALVLAARAGQGTIVEILDPTDKNGVTALMRAVERSDVETVRALIPLQKGKKMMGDAYINGLRISRGTALMMAAAACGKTEMVRLLVEHEKGITDEDGRTALVHATRAGHREAAELLMEHEKDVTGWTMLMCAAVLGNTDMVSQYINERGQKDKLGRTALILAAQNGREEVVNLLVKHENGVSGWTNLIYAAYLGNIDAVESNLHMQGSQDVGGWTALMWAAHRGHTECVKPLLEKEAGMQAENGWTALMFAAYNGNVGCARLLAEREKDMKLTCRWRGYPPGTTALAIARKWCHTEIVSILSK